MKHPLPLGFAYSFARPGLILYSPRGAEAYFQPGDDLATALEAIEAIESADNPEPAAACLWEYFPC